MILLTLLNTPFESWSQNSSFTAQIENDFFALNDPTDIHYTQALRFEYRWRFDKRVPRLFGFIPLPGSFNTTDHKFVTGVVAAQNMYTPRSIKSTTVNPTDRPYAAWLYGGNKIEVVSPTELWQNTYELTVGLLGPEALGDPIQSAVHDFLGDPNPTWVGQVNPAVPVGIFFSFERKWLVELLPSISYFLPSAGFRLGNVFTDASAGGTLLLGLNAPGEFDVTGPIPAIIAVKVPIRLYLSMQGSVRLNAFNFSLDNEFGDGYDVDKRGVVGDFVVGGHLHVDRFAISFLQVFRSSEFRPNTSTHDFGVIRLGWLMY